MPGQRKRKGVGLCAQKKRNGAWGRHDLQAMGYFLQSVQPAIDSSWTSWHTSSAQDSLLLLLLQLLTHLPVEQDSDSDLIACESAFVPKQHCLVQKQLMHPRLGISYLDDFEVDPDQL